MDNVLAIDIGGTRFRVGLFDLEGRPLVISEGDTSRAGGREWMLEQISERAEPSLPNRTLPWRLAELVLAGRWISRIKK